MSSSPEEFRAPRRIVLGDANVLYSRVLRDYLLYSATRQLIRVHWSKEILGEMVSLTGATSVSTIAALGRAGAPRTAELMSDLLARE